MILFDAPHEMPFRKIVRQRRPSATAVGTLDDVGFAVTGLVMIQACVDGVRMVSVGLDVVDEGSLGDVKEAIDLSPILTTVLADLDQPIIRANIQQALDQRRFADGSDVAVRTHGQQIEPRVHPPDAPHHRQRPAIDTFRKIRADGRPRISAIVAPMQFAASEVDALGIVRTDQDRRIPIESKVLLTRSRLRLDVNRLARPPIEPAEESLLRFAVDDVRIGGIDGVVMTVASNGDLPIGIGDPLHESRRNGSILRVVVLSPTDDVIEREIVIDIDFVELSHRQVGKEAVGFAKVVRSVNAPIATDQQKIRIGGMEDNGMVIDVFVLPFDRLKRLASIHTAHERVVGVVDDVESMRIQVDLLVIVRTRPARHEAAHLLPAFSGVLAAEESTFAVHEFNGRINNIALLRRDTQRDFSFVASRDPVG